MKVDKIEIKTKCDFTGCKKLAEYRFCGEQAEKSMSFCSECIKELQKCISSKFAPATVDPPFKKTKKLR